MGLFDLFNENKSSSERIALAIENDALNAEVRYLGGEIKELQEDFLKISDAFDNVGWSPMPDAEAAEIPLSTVKKVAKIARSTYTMNPFVKRGVNARIQYIWGKGINFDGVDDIRDRMDEARRKIFSPQAFEEFERVLATDGNAFTALPIGDKQDTNSVFRIGLDDITNAVSNPLDREDVWFYKREYTIIKTNSQTGEVTNDDVIKYYVSLPHYQKLEKEGKPLPRRFNGVGIEQNYIIQHTCVNKQIGWRWGVPDIMPVIFWAKAYKEYLEDNALLVKAYSRLAWQYKGSSGQSGIAAASVMRPPSRDPQTGELSDIGGTAMNSMGGGELTPMPATGSSVDFSKGSPLASAIAAGLEVSLVVVTSDPSAGNRATAETLDLPTLKAMESRQQIHTERFLELFKFWGLEITPPKGSTNGTTGNKSGSADVAKNLKAAGRARDIQESEAGTPPESEYAVVTWPQIQTDTTLDRIKAIGTAVELGVLYKQEARKEILDVTNIPPYRPWYELPTIEDDPAAAEQQRVDAENADKEFEREQTAAKVVASQGVSGGTSASGGSTPSNSARANRNTNKNNS